MSPTQLPVSVPMMLLFIAHLHAAGSAPAPVVSTVSAVAYFHKINGHANTSHCLAVAKVLGGVRSLGAVPDVRLPVLSRPIHALPALFSSRYKYLMLRAMMVLAFKAYLRIGEMVPRSRSMVHTCLNLHDVLLSGDLITISFRQFKCSAIQGPQSLQIQGACSPGSSIYVAAFHRDFLRATGAKQALLFAYPDGSPVLRREFDVALKQLLIFCGYRTSAFKGHSFRIVAAMAAVLRDESDAQI